MASLQSEDIDPAVEKNYDMKVNKMTLQIESTAQRKVKGAVVSYASIGCDRVDRKQASANSSMKPYVGPAHGPRPLHAVLHRVPTRSSSFDPMSHQELFTTSLIHRPR